MGWDGVAQERLEGRTVSDETIKKESMYINQSLSYLEQCVVALSRRSPGHVPYRQSKLTNVLKVRRRGVVFPGVGTLNQDSPRPRPGLRLHTCAFEELVLSMQANSVFLRFFLTFAVRPCYYR